MTATETRDQFAGARDNAKGWYETIKEQLGALEEAGDDSNAQDEARRTINEGPLSIQVRDGWRSPGAEMRAGDGAEEFEILLTTGGPALRIWGKLSEHGEPESCELQMQDWGTPWTKWAPEPYDDTFHDTLLAYASCFYFGE